MSDLPAWKRRERRGYIFTLDDATRERLETFANERQLTMSSIVEDAINLYIDDQKARKP